MDSFVQNSGINLIAIAAFCCYVNKLMSPIPAVAGYVLIGSISYKIWEGH